MPVTKRTKQSKKPLEELVTDLSACPPRGSLWRHHRGGEYRIVGAAIQEATGAPLVLYTPLEEKQERGTVKGEGGEEIAKRAGQSKSGITVVFARPLSEWEETVEAAGGGHEPGYTTARYTLLRAPLGKLGVRPERNIELLRLYKEGWGPTKLARHYGLTVTRIKQLLGRLLAGAREGRKSEESSAAQAEGKEE